MSTLQPDWDNYGAIWPDVFVITFTGCSRPTFVPKEALWIYTRRAH